MNESTTFDGVQGWATTLILLSIALGGCTTPASTRDATAPSTPGTPPEPSATSWAFQAVLSEAVLYNSQPTLAVGPDDVVFARHFGCNSLYEGAMSVTMNSFLGMEDSRCMNPPAYRSNDGGRTWTYLNREDGRLAPDSPMTVYTPDVAVDAAGTVYAIDGACVGGVRPGDTYFSCQEPALVLHTSTDGGATWSRRGDVFPQVRNFATQEWVTAGDAGHAVIAFKTAYPGPGAEEHPSALGIIATWDGGQTFSGPAWIHDNLELMGKPVLSADGSHVYVPYTLLLNQTSPTERLRGELRVAVSEDGGRTWRDVSTGIVSTNAPQRSACMSGIPSLALTGNGDLVYIYAEPTPGPGGATNDGTVVKALVSRDGGATWSSPMPISQSSTAVAPSALGGAGSFVGIAYAASSFPGDTYYVGDSWDVRYAVVDLATGRVAESVVATGVHEGGMCAVGQKKCWSPELALAPLSRGRVMVVYPSDSASGGGREQLRVAVSSDNGLPTIEPAGGPRE